MERSTRSQLLTFFSSETPQSRLIVAIVVSHKIIEIVFRGCHV